MCTCHLILQTVFGEVLMLPMELDPEVIKQAMESFILDHMFSISGPVRNGKLLCNSGKWYYACWVPRL